MSVWESPVNSVPVDGLGSLCTLPCISLAAVVSAEALFSLIDLCGLDVDRAVDSLRRTARTITEVAVDEIDGISQR